MTSTQTPTADLPSETLQARARLAGWKPADLRATAATLETGTNTVSPYLSDEQAREAAANGRKMADEIEARGLEALAELETRRRNAPRFTGYVA